MSLFSCLVQSGIRNAFVFLTLIGAFLSCCAAATDRYVYSSWGLPMDGWRGKLSMEFVFHSDTFYLRSGSELGQISLCDDDSEFLCLVAHGFSFAIPRVHADQEQKWEHNDRVYEVTSELELLILGTSILVKQIEAEHRDVPDIFYYSDSLGLLGFAYSKRGLTGGTTAPELYFVEALPGLLGSSGQERDLRHPEE